MKIEQLEKVIYPYIASIYGYVFAKADLSGAKMMCTDKDKRVLDSATSELATKIYKTNSKVISKAEKLLKEKKPELLKIQEKANLYDEAKIEINKLKLYYSAWKETINQKNEFIDKLKKEILILKYPIK